MPGTNRQSKQSRREKRKEKGEQLLVEDNKRKMFDNDWNLDWFKPLGMQIECIESFEKNLFTIVDSPSGTGKTSTALWFALHELKNRNYQQLVFIKNPCEVGDFQIGFLAGSESDKLLAHLDTTRRIFHEFMPKNKLQNDESSGKIRLTIPNFLLGASLHNSIVILDESQLMSPDTIKLLMERCGDNSKYIILGDNSQRYSVKKVDDGFSDLVRRVTVDHQGVKWSKYEPMVGYIKMTRHDNQRSSGSKFVNKLYEEED